MSHSKTQVLVHLVWATWRRTAWIDADVEEVIRDSVAAQATRLESPIVAFGSSDDHVHVFVAVSAKVSLVTLVRALKGASGRMVNLRHPALEFHWQEGYAAFSVSADDAPIVAAYVRKQRIRHGTGTIEARFELDAAACNETD